ncbi:MAG: hypothetical protein ACM3YM_08325 [Sphingomonadales bacterium]
MTGKFVASTLAAAALIVAAPSFAHPGGGGGGGMGAGLGAHGGFGGPGMGVQVRDTARVNSQGPFHASDIGISHANENSVLYGTTRSPTIRSHRGKAALRNSTGVTKRTAARTHSRGPAHAADKALQKANENSVLYN